MSLLCFVMKDWIYAKEIVFADSVCMLQLLITVIKKLSPIIFINTHTPLQNTFRTFSFINSSKRKRTSITSVQRKKGKEWIRHQLISFLPRSYGTFTPAIFSTFAWTLTFRLSNGWHCTIWVHSHLQFGQLLRELKTSIMVCVPIFCDCVDWKVHAKFHA